MPITRTVKVIVRHAADRKDRGKGSNWRHCDCWKSLLIYDGETKKNRRERTHTRDWEEAEKYAQEPRDSWDTIKVELKRLRAEKERKQVRIEAAIALYIQDQNN